MNANACAFAYVFWKRRLYGIFIKNEKFGRN